MAENRVLYGLKNVHYAVMTESASSAPTWGTPVAVPGAVNLELTQQSGETNFYADNTAYYQTYANNGYTGTLEMAKIPAAMLEDIWGFTETTTGKVLVEEVAQQRKPFALLFQIEGDDTEELYCFYRCYASRPSVTSQTTGEDGAEVATTSLDITVMPVIDPSSAGTLDGRIGIRTDADTTSTVRGGWFDAVYVTE